MPPPEFTPLQRLQTLHRAIKQPPSGLHAACCRAGLGSGNANELGGLRRTLVPVARQHGSWVNGWLSSSAGLHDYVTATVGGINRNRDDRGD